MDISRFLNFKNAKLFALDVFLWLICGLGLLWASNYVSKYIPFSFVPVTPELPDAVKAASFFLLLVFTFILCKEIIDWIRVQLNKDKIYIFNSKDWPNKWVFNGKTELTKEGYLFVKSSRAGCLLKNYYWKDFRMSFEMKCSIDDSRPQKVVGFIFRAEDLDNYFMIEIGQGDPTPGLKAHVRYKGGWEQTSIEGKTFDFSEFTRISLEVKEDTVRVLLKNTPIFNWILPTHVDVNHVESGVRDTAKKEKQESITVGAVSGHVQRIPFRLEQGLVGFRAHLKHGAIIRNLEIKPL